MSPPRLSRRGVLAVTVWGAAAVATAAPPQEGPPRSAPFQSAPIRSAPPRIDTTAVKVEAVVSDRPRAGAIAVKPNGQAFLVLDGSAEGIEGAAGMGAGMIEDVDLAQPARRERKVAAFQDGRRPVAIACIDSITAAVVVRSGRDWMLDIFRLPAPRTEADPAAPLQSIRLGEAADAGDAAVGIAVGPSRDWLVIAGLPPPLPPVIRGAIANVTVGGLGTRNCPPASGSAGPAHPAVTISPAAELVLFERPDDASGSDRLLMYSTIGTTRLLSLDTGLPRVRAAAYAKDMLWVVAGTPGDDQRPEGLWRLDAAVLDRRQVVRPVCVARLPGARGVAALPNGNLLVLHGDGDRTISLVSPLPSSREPAGETPASKRPVGLR